MRVVKRLSILLILAIGLFYAAAYAAAKPGTVISNVVIGGIILLMLVLPVLNYLKVGRIIHKAFSKDE